MLSRRIPVGLRYTAIWDTQSFTRHGLGRALTNTRRQPSGIYRHLVRILRDVLTIYEVCTSSNPCHPILVGKLRKFAGTSAPPTGTQSTAYLAIINFNAISIKTGCYIYKISIMRSTHATSKMLWGLQALFSAFSALVSPSVKASTAWPASMSSLRALSIPR